MKKISALILVFAVVFSFVGASSVGKSDYSMKISSDNISYELSDSLYGLYLEDISNACDGGLVANLVNNNSFEYTPSPLNAWSISGAQSEVKNDGGLNENNPSYLALTVEENALLTNNGYTELYNNKSYSYNERRANTPDMGFEKGEEYEFSAYFKNVDFEGDVTASLRIGENEEKFKFDIDDCLDWKKVSLSLEAAETGDGALDISFAGSGTLYMDFVSLVPKSSLGYKTDEWKYISLREDMYQAIKTLSPKFIRFPGGCQTEGESLDELFDWKSTLGPLEQRRQTLNPHRDDEGGRPYLNTNSMGYHEYFTLCDSLGAAPIPVLNAGIVCQSAVGYSETYDKYKNGAMTEEKWQEYLDTIALRPGTEKWKAYIQNILDLIEYANGAADTVWGAKRAENGHPEPFNIKYIAIGSENYGEVYWRNFDAVYNEIKAKYPDITVITTVGSAAEGEELDKGWETVGNKYRSTVVDEHYCTVSDYHLNGANRYDAYERSGAGVFVNEYAAYSGGSVMTKNSIFSAIENAAFLTGLERNADIVKMATYSPLFSKINAQSRDVGLIWFDSHSILPTPDYFVQMMFANNYGTHHITTDFDREDEGVYQSVTVDTENEVIYVKLVNSTRTDHKIDISLKGFENANSPTVQYMDETFKSACNEPGEQLRVAPRQKELELSDGTVSCDVGSLSVSVVRIPYGKNDGTMLFELPDTGLISPYVHPAITIAIPLGLGLLVLVTIGVILSVRIRHHKDVYKKHEKDE